MIESNKNSLFFIVWPTFPEDKRQKRFVNILFLVHQKHFSECEIWVYLCIVSRLQFGRTPIVGGRVVNTNFVNANSHLNSIFNLFFSDQPWLIHQDQTSAMNYARTENWIRNFTNPLKNWRRHAKPGPFEAAWNRGIEHEIAGTSQTITTAHTILPFYIFPVALLTTNEKISGRQSFSISTFWIWTIYSFSFLTWLTALYEKQPLVTV